MKIRTVGDLIDELKKYDPSTEIALCSKNLRRSYDYSIISIINGYNVHDQNFHGGNQSEPDPYIANFVRHRLAHTKQLDGVELLDVASPYIKPAITLIGVDRPLDEYKI